MGVVLRRHHRRLIPTLIIISTFLFLTSSYSAATASLNRPKSDLAHRSLRPSVGLGESRKETSGSGLTGRIIDQKRLNGPGSVPPRCRSKCEKCEPCKAVRLTIQPGRLIITPTEYYPEAWRCVCGNKIFLP
ncbi:unnamed protein product [Cochlearia groenlandica]